MSTWYWMNEGRPQGPITSQELKALAASGQITEDTMIAKAGADGWVAAANVKGLFERRRQPPDPPPASGGTDDRAAGYNTLGAARDHAATLLRDLRSLDWKEEIVPLDASNVQLLTRDYVFWSVLLLGVVPSLIGTIDHQDFQLNAYLFFFAAMWGVVFRDFIVRAPASWKWLVASAAFTALIGLPGLLLVHGILPEAFMKLRESPSFLTNLLGSIFVTGVTEEICKATPVIAYLVWKQERAEPLTAILLGVFSGLGFAAIENVQYTENSLLRPLLQGSQGGGSAYLHGVQAVISQALLRSFSAVFGHAVLAGIVAYFLVVAFLTKRRKPVLAVVGLGLSALLHGCYNWLAPLQFTFATLIDAGAFLLFYGYLTKIRNLISETASPTHASDANEVSSTSSAHAAAGP